MADFVADLLKKIIDADGIESYTIAYWGPHEWTRMKHLSLLELQVLLAIMSLRPNASAGSILNEINKRTKRQHWHGTIYAALDRLERQGLVKRVLERKATPKRGGKRKFLFALTPTGRQTLTRSLRTIVPFLHSNGLLPAAQRRSA